MKRQLKRAAEAGGPVPDALKPDFQGVRTHWNRGFMAFRKFRHTPTAILMVPELLERFP